MEVSNEWKVQMVPNSSTPGETNKTGGTGAEEKEASTVEVDIVKCSINNV